MRENMANPVLLAVLAGRIEPLGADGVPSGIRKHVLNMRISVTPLGLPGDAHADQRHHGGVDKAVHHYPHEHYAAWRRELPERAPDPVTGGFGENLSSTGLDEENVCVGDVFRVGEALLQVSQGRTPCRKLELRFGVADMAARVAASGRTGWYYRVLRPGLLGAGDAFVLMERPCPEWSVARVQQTLSGRVPDRRALALLASLSELATGWRDKAVRRLIAARA